MIRSSVPSSRIRGLVGTRRATPTRATPGARSRATFRDLRLVLGVVQPQIKRVGGVRNCAKRFAVSNVTRHARAVGDAIDTLFASACFSAATGIDAFDGRRVPRASSTAAVVSQPCRSAAGRGRRRGPRRPPPTSARRRALVGAAAFRGERRDALEVRHEPLVDVVGAHAASSRAQSCRHARRWAKRRGGGDNRLTGKFKETLHAATVSWSRPVQATISRAPPPTRPARRSCVLELSERSGLQSRRECRESRPRTRPRIVLGVFIPADGPCAAVKTSSSGCSSRSAATVRFLSPWRASWMTPRTRRSMARMPRRARRLIFASHEPSRPPSSGTSPAVRRPATAPPGSPPLCATAFAAFSISRSPCRCDHLQHAARPPPPS